MTNYDILKEYEAHKTTVPSYDEWQASEKYNKHLEEVIKIYERKDKQATETSIAYGELLEENEKLKEEYEKECHRADELEDSYWKSEKENAQLKELLKECREPLEVFAEKRDACDWCPEDLLTKIDEVLK